MVTVADRRILPPHQHQGRLLVGFLNQIDIDRVGHMSPQAVFEKCVIGDFQSGQDIFLEPLPDSPILQHVNFCKVLPVFFGKAVEKRFVSLKCLKSGRIGPLGFVDGQRTDQKKPIDRCPRPLMIPLAR